MARIEDFLTKRQIDKIYNLVGSLVLELPKVRKNSWDAFFQIIFLVLIADGKIRPAELGFFKRIIDATFSEDWEVSSLLTGKIPSEQRLVEIGSRVLQVYTDVDDLAFDSAKEIAGKFAENINKKSLQKITLLTCIRLAISDLEVANKEKSVIECLIETWKLEELADSIKFQSMISNDPHYIVNDMLRNDQNIMEIIDRKGLRHSNYEEVVHLIHKAGLMIPGDELVSEQFKVYRQIAETSRKTSEAEALKQHQQHQIKKKKKHNLELKNMKKKLATVQTRYGAEFICATFLPELNFHRNSFDLINDKFESSIVWSILQKLGKQELYLDQSIKTKKIEGKQGWYEISGIFTGDGTRASMGRIYYHASALPGKKYNAFVDFKIDEKLQKKVFKLLDAWKKRKFA
jgi:hypothetical protein